MSIQNSDPRPTPAARRALKRGDTLAQLPEDARTWQLRRGLLLVERHPPGAPASLRLALPGDWVALDGLAGLPADTRLTALVPSEIAPLANMPQTPSVEQLQQVLHQTQRAADHLLALRTGDVESRLKHLLGLLRLGERSARRGAPAPGWPALRHLALLIDAAPETVCRLMARLRPTPAQPSLALG